MSRFWNRLLLSAAIIVLPLPAQASEEGGGIAALDWAVLIFYLLTLVGIGLYFARREDSTEDYFVAGRTMPWWAAGVSIFGTQLSAITFLAVPAKAFAVDWVYFLVNMTIIMVAPVVVYLYLPFLRGTGVTSAYEYLERRFSLGVRIFGAVAFLLFQIGRMGIILYLPAIVLATVTGVDAALSIILMGILATGLHHTGRHQGGHLDGCEPGGGSGGCGNLDARPHHTQCGGGDWGHCFGRFEGRKVQHVQLDLGQFR